MASVSHRVLNRISGILRSFPHLPSGVTDLIGSTGNRIVLCDLGVIHLRQEENADDRHD